MIWWIGYTAIAIVILGIVIQIDSRTDDPSVGACFIAALVWPASVLLLIGAWIAHINIK